MSTFEDRLLTELQAVVAERGAVQRWRPRRLAAARPRRLVATGVAAAVALGGALAATELLASNAARPASSAYSLVADFLNQAAAAARTQTVAQPGPGQLYFTLSYLPGTLQELKNGHAVNAYPGCAVSWYTPQGRPLASIVEGVEPADKQCEGVSVKSPGKRFKPTAPHWYPSLASLSHDPRTLLAQLDAAADRGPAYWSLGAGTGPEPTRDQIAFTLVERLLQAPISADLRAALYQATIGIRGVSLDPHTVDALGRPGTGVSMRLPDGAGSFFTSEFILARHTFTFLGTATFVPGMAPSGSARVRTGIVNADGA